MAVKIPNASEITWLKNVLNYVAAQDIYLKLYTNNVTPGDTDTAASYTEASGGGYAAASLTGSSWSVSTNGSGEAEASYAAQTFSFTGPLAGGATIYGAFAVQQSSGLLMFAERFQNAFTPVSNGDSKTYTPKLTLGSKY